MSDRKKAEKNLLDYVKTNVRSFDEIPFNNADGLVFTQVANMRLENSGIDIGAGEAKPFVTLYQDMQDGLGHAAAKRSFYAMTKDNRELLQALAESPRFRGVMVGNFVENPASQGVAGFTALNEETAIEQFAAVTMTYVQKDQPVHFMAFRATDGSADGWTEDLLLLASDGTQSQEDSKNYMNLVGEKLDGPLCGGGHSKGGNNFEYGYLFCNDPIRRRIETGYLYDSPGLYKGVIDQSLYDSLFQQVIHGHFLCPQDAIIGLLLHENQNAAFIHSVETGLGEHDPYSWEVDPQTGDFRPGEQSMLSKYMNEALDRSVNKMTATEREALYGFAYYIMQSYGDTEADGGIGKIVRLFTHGWHTEDGRLRLAKLGEIWQVFADDWNSMSNEKQAFFLDSLGCILTSFAAVSFEYAWDAAGAWVEEKKAKLRAALDAAVQQVGRWVSQKQEACKQVLLSAYDAFEEQLGRFIGLCRGPACTESESEPAVTPDAAVAVAAPAPVQPAPREREPAKADAQDLRRYVSRLRRVSRTIALLDVEMDALMAAANDNENIQRGRPPSLLIRSWQVGQCTEWLNETAGKMEAEAYRGREASL
ncbi:MAG: DUF2974 domain-containing protein [Clostridiales bacterium]|nr:DUF2974 domain-containing protein [Clostridiales bacterium]